ncbi:hypothetical protein [Candidatus Poriferisocius sp.]|uniref:hypothetical protein n=1 Tax=Candidatus Poriferisocius sp. TaxID=3101276 RepID=UPI003B0157A4
MARSFARLLGHPSLWITAVRMGWRLRLLPDPAYLKFRMVTMYGDADAQPRADDLITYLRWCKVWERTG